MTRQILENTCSQTLWSADKGKRTLFSIQIERNRFAYLPKRFCNFPIEILNFHALISNWNDESIILSHK